MLSAKQLGTFTATTSGGTVVVYTVPAGHLAILRDVRLYSNLGAASTARLQVWDAGAALVIDVVKHVDAGAAFEFVQDAFIVLQEAETIRLRHTGSGAGTVLCSGHEFAIP